MQVVLVHSPLVGPASWDAVAADLAGRGYEVRALGWVVARRMSHHVAQLTEPGMVAAALCELLGQLR